jgi:hypothetical protein
MNWAVSLIVKEKNESLSQKLKDDIVVIWQPRMCAQQQLKVMLICPSRFDYL